MKVCSCCFNDQEIAQFIKTNSKEKGKCGYCSSDSDLLDIDELADFFASLLSIYKEATDGMPLTQLVQKDWELFSNEQVDKKLVLGDILISINSSFSIFSKATHIEEIKENVAFWDTLKYELKNKRRFLTDTEQIIDYGWDTFFNVFSTFDSSVNLFRARIHYNEEQEKPFFANAMGCPKIAYSEGRANPKGIPYLYLCKDIETTFYETRASYLDYISVGLFKVIKPNILKIVDFTKHLSPFNNATNIIEFSKGKILRDIISKDLSKPLHRFDSELEYIPTQFICEFIRYFYDIDGIQFFSSLKKGGVNVVLFSEDKITCNAVELHQISEIKINSQIIPF
ncbi:hypothetical protein FACS189426_16020 [Bacteroidia bacterium]|nr:hypothetical protein FACS189426_16020 [Bacteroidia bacterium]